MAFTVSDVFNDNGITSLRKDFREDYDQLGKGQVIKDALAAGTGYMLHTGRDAMSASGKPSYESELDWQKSQDAAGPLEKAFGLSQSFGKTIADYGRKLETDHSHNYSEGSANRYISGISQAGPTMVGLGLAAAGAIKSSNPRLLGQLAQNIAARGGYGATEKLMRTSSPLLGNAAVKITPYVTKYTPKITELAGDVAPSAVVGFGAAIPEAMLEKQSAYDDVIAEAKQNGTYVAGETEKKATHIGDQVFKMNVDLLSGTNMFETVLTFSKLRGILPKNSFLRNAGKLGAVMASEGLQEGAQQIIPKIAANKPWSYKDQDVQEAATIGALSGGLFHGTGRLANSFMDKRENKGALGEVQTINSPENQDNSAASVESSNNPISSFYKSGAGDIDSYIDDAANAYKVNPNLIHAVAQTESNYQADAVSEVGAQGIMQLMPETAAGLGVKDSFDPQQNINGGAKYLAECLKANNGDVHQALAMYNGGQGYMNTAEAQAYADKVMDTYNKISKNGANKKTTASPNKKYYNVLNEVSNTNLTSLTENKLNLLARDFNNEFGTQLNITSMKRDGDGSSWHDSGQAVDMVADILEKDPNARQWLVDRGKQYGLVGLDEYANPSAQATGGHIHFSDHGDALADNVTSSTDETLQARQYTEKELNNMAFGMDDVFNSGRISPGQRKAILEMAKEQTNALQGEMAINNLEDAIQIKDIEAISKILPKETAEILFPRENNQTPDTQEDFQQEKDLQSQSNTAQKIDINKELMQRSHEAAEQGDYTTAHQLAHKADNNNWSEVYKRMRDRQNKKASQSNESHTDNIKNQALPQKLLPQKNNSLKSTLQSNRELIAGKGSTDSNTITPEQTNNEMRSYGKELLQKAKENGIKANYAKLKDHIEHGVYRAITDLEERLMKNGIDIQPIPKGDRNLQRSIKRESPVYSRPGLDSATTSNSSAVSKLNGENVKAANLVPTSVKPNDSLINHNIPQKQETIQGSDNGKASQTDVEANVQHGMAAMEKVIAEHVDVENAMYRDDVGDISFYWGEPGRGSKFKKGRGISHIIAKRDFENGTGLQTARKMVEVIAKGDITTRQEAEKGSRVFLEYDSHTAVLSLYKNGEEKTWLLTGWTNNKKEETPNATTEVYDSDSATTDGTTRFRSKREEVSSINYSIPQKQKTIQGSDSGRASQADVQSETVDMEKPQQEQPKETPFNKDRARSKLDQLIGRKKKSPKQPVGIVETENKKKFVNVFDESDLDAEIEAMKKELSKMSANPVFNPTLMKHGFKVGGIYLQKGINKTADWAEQMVKTLGEAVNPYLKSIWEALQSYPEGYKFNDDIMTAIFEYVGAEHADGKTIDEIKAGFAEEYGEEYSHYINSAYEGVKNYPTEEEIENVDHDSAGAVAKRTGERDNQNQVGADDGGRKSGGRGQQPIQPSGSEIRPRGGVRVHGDRAARSGEISDRRIQNEESSNNAGSTGSERLPRSIRDNFDGQAGLDSGRTGSDTASSKDRRNDAAPVKENKKKYKAGDLDSVKNDLPMLLPEQQEDVVFAERRLLENEKNGVLFTNGTGTGKTFTGLGVIKRFVNQDKKNILVISPNDKINSEWVKAGKGFFDIEVTPIKNTKDAGKGVSITTFANMGENNKLIERNWDLVIVDESQNLMSSEQSDGTKALKNLRAVTFHQRGLAERFQREHATEYKEIHKAQEQLKQAEQDKNTTLSKKLETFVRSKFDKLDALRRQMIEKWGNIDAAQKPKVTFLSATPFAYVNNIDYAEGYLFDYAKQDSGGYNQPGGKEQFMIENFGYRMRSNKLTRPEGSVDSGVMEVQFHEKLRKEGALSGRVLTVDHDYDRGFLLVDGGIGKKIDEGFEWLGNKDNGNFDELLNYLNSTYKYHDKMYLLEAIKARGVVDLIKQYQKAGKKVVVFHGFKKGGATHPFRRENIPNDLKEQYQEFAARRPDLVGMNLKGLQSPIETLQQAFGNDLLLFNGDISKNQREANVEAFNDDKNNQSVILVQSDAGQAGISLHDKTGKYQRVLVNLGMPTKPVAAIQTEGRIYRVGQKSNAIFRYLNTGTMLERTAFASRIAERASTAENLALGKEARNLKNSFIEAFEESIDGDGWKRYLPGQKEEGTGGKARDKTVQLALTDFDRAKTFYYGQGKKNSKTKAAEGNDYFATPEPLGLKMVEWADIHAGESVLEPSAGHGAIARWFPANTNNVAVEQSNKLAPRAKMAMQSGDVITGDFDDYYIGNKFDAVVMNPPFGTGGKTAIDHVSKAFRHLKDGGRIVAIVPDGASCQKHFEKWFYGNENGQTKAERDGEKNAVLVKEILLPNVAFKNAGTQVACKVLVIDKQETQAGREQTETEGTLEFRDAKTIEEFFDRIENISLPKRYKAPEETIKEGIKEPSSSAEEGKFKVDSFRHTKTGEMIPRAVLNERIDDFKSLNSLARRHGGYYSSVAKGFLFKENNAARDKFVKEANALLEGGKVKLSTGQPISLDDVLDNIEFIEDERLVKKELAIAKAGEKFGTPVVFFKADRKFDGLNGFHRGGITFINLYAHVPHKWVFWHESFHWMSNNNPALYNKLLSYFKGTSAFTQKQLDAYRKTIGRPELTNDEAIEEILADAMADVSRRVGLMKQLGKENASLAERLVAWIKDTMERFHEFFTTPAEGLSPVQKKSMVKAFTALARDMVDADGRNIFAVDRTSGEITLQRNGKPISSVLQDTAAAYSAKGSIDKGVNLADNVSKEEERYLEEFEQSVLDKIEKNGAQILNRFDPADGLEKLREYFVSDETFKNRTNWLKTYEKIPNASIAILKLGQLNRCLGLERKEILKNGRIVKEIEQLLIQRNEGGGYSEIIERVQGYRLSLDLRGRSGDNRRNGKGDGAERQISRLDLKVPAEREPQGVHLTAYKEALEKYDKLMEEKAAAEQEHNETIEHSEKGAFSMGENKPKFSIDHSEHTLIRAVDNLLKKAGLKTADGIQIATEDTSGKVNVFRNIFNSMNKIAERYPKLKPFFRLGNIAREKQENLRDHFQHRLDKIEKLLGRKAFGKKNSPDYEENKQDLFEILGRGDAVTKEFTISELKTMGYNDKVIQSYRLMRAAIRRAYDLVNTTKQRIVSYSKNVSKKEYENLANNKFVHIVQKIEKPDGSYFVTYKQPKIYEKKEILSKSELDVLKNDENVQIISAKAESNTVFAMSESQGVLRGDDFYEVEYRTQIAPLGKIEGYIPHFFHNFFIMQKVVDEKGNTGYKLLKSAKTLREAIIVGNGLVKQDSEAEILISQKQFQFPDEKMQATVIGDKEYFKMMKKLSDDLSINLQDAQKLMHDKVAMKNRKRFFGNSMHRKGVEGFEKDMNWVMRHYFNQVARYVAMDEFKCNSINRFEQIFGEYDGIENQKGVAGFARDFINDVNGMPTGVENFLNDLIKATPGVNKVFGKFFPDRPSLQAAGLLTSIAAAAKLNCFNLGSTIIQFTQLMNIGGTLNSYDYALKGMRAALKPTLGQKVILRQAGLEAEMGMNISGGYSKAEIANKFIGMSTWTFTQSDRILRSTAILGAYKKGIDEGMTKAQAIEYAKEMNRKANFDYAVTDAPNLFRRTGPAGQVILQFQKYSIKQMELMWDMFAQGKKIDTSSMHSIGKSFLDILKNNDKGQMARFFLPYFMLSGMMGIPFVSLFGSFIGMLFGWDDWEEKVKKNAFELAGSNETAQAMVRLGIYGATAMPKDLGVDIGYRVGIGDFASMELPKSQAETLFKLFGVTGSSLYQAMYQNGQGNTNEAIKAISPGFGNIAIALSNEVKTTRGRVKHSFGDDFYGRILKAVGFMPINERMETDVNRIIKIEETERKSEEKKAIDDYIAKPSTENLNRLREMKIKPKRVQEERKKKKMSSLERLSKREKENYRDLRSQ